MTIEAKFTAGPFAEGDEWAVPLSILAEHILDTGTPDLPAPISVSIQWAEGNEITYQRIGAEETAKSDDEAWLDGFFHGNRVEREVTEVELETEDEEFTLYGWVHSSGRFMPASEVVNMDDWLGWERVYKAA